MCIVISLGRDMFLVYDATNCLGLELTSNRHPKFATGTHLVNLMLGKIEYACASGFPEWPR